MKQVVSREDENEFGDLLKVPGLYWYLPTINNHMTEEKNCYFCIVEVRWERETGSWEHDGKLEDWHFDGGNQAVSFSEIVFRFWKNFFTILKPSNDLDSRRDGQYIVLQQS